MKVIRFCAHPALEILGVEMLALALLGVVNLVWKGGGLLTGYVAAAPVVFSWSAAMVMTQFSEVYSRLALSFGATRRQITVALVFWWFATAGLAALQASLFRPLIAALNLAEGRDFINAIYQTPVVSWFWLTLLANSVLMLSVFLPPRGWGLAGRVILNCLVLLGERQHRVILRYCPETKNAALASARQFFVSPSHTARNGRCHGSPGPPAAP